MIETLEIEPKNTPPQASVEIPSMDSMLVENKLEKLVVLVRFWVYRFFLISSYFGHPFKTLEAIKRLTGLRKEFMGEFKPRKLVRAGDHYFFNLNQAALFTKPFKENFIDELDRLYYNKRKRTLRVLLFGITRKCGYKCEHCYEWDNLSPNETLSEESVDAIIQKFQERGVGQIQFGGGEPLSRYTTILNLLKKYSQDSDFAIVTSGFQLTEAKAKALKEAGLRSVTVSLDHFAPEPHDSFRGYIGAFEWAIKAVTNAKKAGLLVNLSICPTRDFISKENMEEYMNLAKKLGVGFVWMIEPQPAGHYKGKDVRLDQNQIELLTEIYETYNFDPAYEKYPPIAYPAYHQRRVGCLGGGNRFLYVDTKGDLKSCPMCGSSHGKAETADLDSAIDSMQSEGCSPFKNAIYSLGKSKN